MTNNEWLSGTKDAVVNLMVTKYGFEVNQAREAIRMLERQTVIVGPVRIHRARGNRYGLQEV